VAIQTEEKMKKKIYEYFVVVKYDNEEIKTIQKCDDEEHAKQTVLWKILGQECTLEQISLFRAEQLELDFIVNIEEKK
jgi:hypothetical protein